MVGDRHSDVPDGIPGSALDLKRRIKMMLHESCVGEYIDVVDSTRIYATFCMNSTTIVLEVVRMP